MSLSVTHLVGFGSSAAAAARAGVITVNSNSTNWTGDSGYFTFDSNGDIYRGSASYNFSIQRNGVLTNDFEFRFKFPNETGTGSAGSTATFQFGLSTSSGIAGSVSSLYQRNNSALWYFTVNGTGSQTVTLYHQQSSLGTASRTIAADDILGIRRTAGALTFIHNGVDIGTFTGFSDSNTMYPALGHGGAGNGSPWKFKEVTWEVDIS